MRILEISQASINLSPDVFGLSTDNVDPVLKWATGFFKSTIWNDHRDETFNVNIGAIEAVGKLCNAGIPYIYVGEHSCEASVPEGLRSVIRIESTGNPERISLAGHDEYTIKFSYLEKVAASSWLQVHPGSVCRFYSRYTDGRGSLCPDVRWTLF